MTGNTMFIVLDQALFQNLFINCALSNSHSYSILNSTVMIIDIQKSVFLFVETLEMKSKGNYVDEPPATDCIH